MKLRVAMFVLAVLAAGLVLSLAQLFQWRLSQGDVFPEYSSLRDDPLGLGVLHDALSQMPEMRVERQLNPVSALSEQPARTLIVAGATMGAWSGMTRDDFDALNSAVRGGSRLVIAFRAKAAAEKSGVTGDTQGKAETKTKDAGKTGTKAGQKKSENTAGGARLPATVDLKRLWGAEPKTRRLAEPGVGAVRSSDPVAQALPASVAWASDLYFEFEPSAGWHVLYERGGSPVLAERALGKGSIVLAGDSYFLSNEALQRDRATTLLTWVVGPLRRVTFDESHLGVIARPGVAALARRYGLWAACCSLVLLGVLYVWQQSAWFVPPPAEVEEVALVYHPAEGLHALLRRSVPPTEVVATAVAEWRQTSRETERQRVDAALAAAPKDAAPPELYNRVVRALRRR